MRNYLILVAFAGFAVVLLGCGDSGKGPRQQLAQIETIDMKAFYFPTAFDGKTRYYVFEDELTMEGQESMFDLSSKRVERIGNDQLVFVEYQHYTDTVIAVDSAVVRIRKDGLYYEASYFYGNDGWVAYENSGTKKFLSWNWKVNEVTHFDRKISKNLAEKQKVEPRAFESELRFNGTGQLVKPFHSAKKYAILNGKSTSYRGDASKEFDLSYWDLEGVGLYRFSMTSDGYEYTSTMVDIISKEAYLELFE